MRFDFAAKVTTLMALTAQAVHAHPGHVHGPGPVHGYSWIDLAGFLLASVALPAAAWLVAHWRNRRR